MTVISLSTHRITLHCTNYLIHMQKLRDEKIAFLKIVITIFLEYLKISMEMLHFRKELIFKLMVCFKFFLLEERGWKRLISHIATSGEADTCWRYLLLLFGNLPICSTSLSLCMAYEEKELHTRYLEACIFLSGTNHFPQIILWNIKWKQIRIKPFWKFCNTKRKTEF